MPCTWGMRDLSPRQREILALVAAGRTSKEIAGELGISESTVNWHIANVFERLGASSRAEAVATALREDAQLPDYPASAKRAESPPLPMSTETIAIAVALTLVIGLLGGALMAGWNVTPPTSPSSSAAPGNRAPESAEPTARPTGVRAPKESTTEPAAQTPAVAQTTFAPALPGIAPVLPAIAPTGLPVASPLPGGPALPTLPPLPSVPLLPAAPMTGR